jgi:beta-lactamase class A
MNLSKNKKSLGIAILSVLATNAFTYYVTTKRHACGAEMEVSDSSSFISNSSCSYNIKRLNGFNYIKPLLFVDDVCESDRLSPIKQTITNLIEEYKKTGTINSASVYLKEYPTNDWIAINSEEKFMPGSLMKVPQLITFLKMEEARPGTLDKQLTFNQTVAVDKHPKYLSKTIQLGHSYSIRELLNYMIVYSDNNATSLLFANMDLNMFKKVFTDLGMAAPDLSASNYPITSKDVTIFMRILYNSSYLSDKHSEFATELLGKCNFKDGLVGGLPTEIKVAHKFGESGDPIEKQLSETAIVYFNDTPYILTVMLKGKDYKNLPDVIKQISSTVYQSMAGNSKTAS